MEVEVDQVLIAQLLDAFVFLPREEQERIVAEVREIVERQDAA